MTIALRLSRPWPTALFLSLAANAFLVGLLIWQAGPDHPPRPGDMLDHMMWRMDEALPDRDAAILRTEPFDEAGFGEAFARMDAEVRGHHERFQAGLLQALRAMSPDGRRAFAGVEPP